MIITNNGSEKSSVSFLFMVFHLCGLMCVILVRGLQHYLNLLQDLFAILCCLMTSQVLDKKIHVVSDMLKITQGSNSSLPL